MVEMICNKCGKEYKGQTDSICPVCLSYDTQEKEQYDKPEYEVKL